jgi:CRP-like cAMP-binding protein
MSKLFRYFGIRVSKGEYIFREGDEADTLYLIHKGSVKISKSVGNLEKRIQVLREGEFVGEMAVINSLPRSADAVALEDCELIKMDRVSFDSTIEKNKQFALSFISFLSVRLRDTTDQLAEYYDRNHHLEVLNELLMEIIRNGRKDQSGKWQLVKLDDFVGHYNMIHRVDHVDIMAMIDELVRRDEVRLKTDQARKTWIAVRSA